MLPFNYLSKMHFFINTSNTYNMIVSVYSFYFKNEKKCHRMSYCVEFKIIIIKKCDLNKNKKIDLNDRMNYFDITNHVQKQLLCMTIKQIMNIN